MTRATRIFSVATLTIISAPLLTAQPMVPPPPPPTPRVIVPAPAPLPVPVPGVRVNIGVPDSYVWDGYEYIGFIGGEYYYVGANNLWLPLVGDRLKRFHDWERNHHDWRTHAIRNERYRRDAHGLEHPWPAHDGDHHDHDSH
jgi:hypothetical protein